MASSNPILFGFFSLVLFFFVSAIRSEELSELPHPHHHHVPLTSLVPSSTCTSPPQGTIRKGSLQVVHKHGPCSALKQHTSSSSSSSSSSSFIIPHSEILKQDEARVSSIHSKLSKKQSHHHEQVDSSKGLGQDKLPAKSGDLIGSGNYFVTVALGSPKRELSLIFDTGSDLTWTQCKPCAGSCYSQKEPIFDPSQSSSYSNISCSSSQCSQLSSATGNNPACSKSTGACIYGIQYGDGSFSVGYFAKETLTISQNDVVQGFLFGCGQDNEGLFRGVAGLLGLGRNPISFVEQSAAKYHKIFSYCIPSTPSSIGFLSFGGSGAGPAFKFTPLTSIPRGASFYGVDFTGISLAGVKLPVNAATFSAGTILDSGTVITRLPPAAYGPLRDAFRKAMSKYPTADPVPILDTCYDLSKYKTFDVPKITLSFGGGVNVELDERGILYVVSAKQVCLAFSPNQDSNSVTIIGNVQQKTLEVVYDVGAGKVGFRPGGCM